MSDYIIYNIGYSKYGLQFNICCSKVFEGSYVYILYASLSTCCWQKWWDRWEWLVGAEFYGFTFVVFCHPALAENRPTTQAVSLGKG